MKALRNILVILLLSALCLQASAQGDTLRFTVRGSVRDASGGRALEAVSVSIPGTSYATVSNRDGSFVIKSDVKPSFVSFSLLGYNTLTLPVQEGEMRVRLSRGNIELDPATVISGNPRAIVEYAISLIDKNFPDKPELFDCFYRETVRKRSRFIYVSEAVTKVYKSAASNFWGRDRASVEKSRLLVSPKMSDTLGVKVLGGPAMAADLDIVKTRSMVADLNQLDYYNFEMLLPDVIDGRTQFVIRFSPAIDVDYALQNGTLYIDRETFAFTRVETFLDVSNPTKATNAMLVKRPSGLRFRPKEMSLLLDYKEEGGKYRLSYLRTQFRFNCDWRKRLFATDYTAVSEMVVTNRHTGVDAAPIQREDEFSSRTSLADKTQYYADPGFWDAYNIIEPTVSLERAIGNLLKK